MEGLIDSNQRLTFRPEILDSRADAMLLTEITPPIRILTDFSQEHRIRSKICGVYDTNWRSVRIGGVIRIGNSSRIGGVIRFGNS
jgi:hypothetical protein